MAREKSLPSSGLDDDDYVMITLRRHSPHGGVVEELICPAATVSLFICGSATFRPSARAFDAVVFSPQNFYKLVFFSSF